MTVVSIEASGSSGTSIDPSSIETGRLNNSEFLDAIGRADLKEIITHQTPWAYWTMELYGEGIKGQGGLGILAADTVQVARDLGLPMVCVTPFYNIEESQEIFYLTDQTRDQLQDNGVVPPKNFLQTETEVRVTPEERGYSKAGQTSVATAFHPQVPLDIYTKSEGSVTVVTVTEPNIGKVYQGGNSSDHRLYQDVVLGFGGYKALKQLGVNPSMNQQLNEAPTVFSALARLDERMKILKVENPEVDTSAVFARAFVETKEKTIYTNHTLVQAVESEFTLEQFENFVMPNIESEELKIWLRDKINGKDGRIKLSTLAIALSGKRNGVSLIHAREASKTYVDYEGNPVEFEGITNGISDVWLDPKLKDLYQKEGVRDKFGLPTKDYTQRIQDLDSDQLRLIRDEARIRLRSILATRKDQYGNSVNIPNESKVFAWNRRIAGYKQPSKLFEEPEVLAQLLESEDIHLVMAGRAHPTDTEMKRVLADNILEIIDKNPILRARVHFVQDYDRSLGLSLAQGADVSINTPTVRDPISGQRISTEACGTSWEKFIYNLTLLVSYEDGGVADKMVEAEKGGRLDSYEPAYLKVGGDSPDEERQLLYAQLRRAVAIVDNRDPQYSWGSFVKKQLTAYLPTISGSRMNKDYIDYGMPVAA